LNGKYSRHNVAYHTSDVYSAETIPSRSLIEKAAKILNTENNRVVILVGQGIGENTTYTAIYHTYAMKVVTT